MPADRLAKYKELLNEKRELKRVLKKFDENFIATNHRNPSKADKEVRENCSMNGHCVL